MWEIIGWIGSGIVVISMLQQRITRLRLVNLIGCIVSVVYSVAIGAWPLAGLNAALSVIQIYHLAKLWGTRHDTSSYRAVEVEASSEIVAHVLSEHAEEIRTFFPSFRDPSGSTSAFLVMHGDTVAGLMLATQNGDVADLDVDFVIPAYRDLTPGEFVFRRSSMWQDKGVRTVRAAVGGPDYYERMGFSRAGDRYELELAAAH